MRIVKQLSIALLCIMLLLSACGSVSTDESDSSERESKSSKRESDSNERESNSSGQKKSHEKPKVQDYEKLEAVDPETSLSQFMDALTSGDWNTINNMISSLGVLGGTLSPESSNGVTLAAMSTLTYEVVSIEEEEPGRYRVMLQVENVDIEHLITSLPDDISSAEEARQEMLRQLDSTPRKTYDAELILVERTTPAGWYIEPDYTFINAITGGFADLYIEVMEGDQS